MMIHRICACFCLSMMLLLSARAESQEKKLDRHSCRRRLGLGGANVDLVRQGSRNYYDKHGLECRGDQHSRQFAGDSSDAIRRAADHSSRRRGTHPSRAFRDRYGDSRDHREKI